MGAMAWAMRLLGVLLLSLIVFGCGSGGSDGVSPTSVGLVAFSSGWLGVIDPATQTVSTPFLVGELGSVGGGLFDVVITPDGNTAMVSNFGDSTVHFIDISVLSAPGVLGSVLLSFFAEDIALTPDGRYALVTDGGFSPGIAVIDVENRSLVEEYMDDSGNHFQAVAVAADGTTVLAVEYMGAKVHSLTLDDLGHLTYVGSIDISNDGTLQPVNVSISPDGKTAIVAAVASADLPAVPADNMRYPVLEITAPGEVELKGFVSTASRLTASQSIVFNPRGTKAYALSNQEDSDPLDLIAPNNVIVELAVAGPGAVSDSAITTTVDFIGSSQLFGVDALAIDRTGRYLYVSNMTLSGALNQLQIVDVETASVVKTISFEDVMVPPVDGTLESAIPTGVFIR